MIDYIYIGMIILFVLILIIIAKVEHDDEMKERDD